MNTASVSLAVTPTVVSTLFSHVSLASYGNTQLLEYRKSYFIPNVPSSESLYSLCSINRRFAPMAMSRPSRRISWLTDCSI